MISFRNLITSGLLTISLAACTESSSVFQAEHNKEDADIFSIRPVTPFKTVLVLTLSEPALLNSATRKGTKLEISEEAKSKLLAEQAQAEAKLAQISSDIRILYRYRMTLNGLAVVTRSDLIPAIQKIASVKTVGEALPMARPNAVEAINQGNLQSAVNSVNFINASKANALGFKGQGMRVGIIDTGIDYTHQMLGGSGNPADYTSVNPSGQTSLYPNKKVVGGRDFVGTAFNSSSEVERARIPVPDENPLDEAGHGTHVAGTVAGLGDGVNTYTGVAPEAQLYALKVFGKEGTTTDSAVVAAMEFAADPNGDLNGDDRLDVVNLSLGGGYGQPQGLYDQAVKNLTAGGTVVVASAGNSGDHSYIVGSPGTSTEALSVAASVDGSEVNWKFATSKLISPNNSNWLVKATEGPISAPIKDKAGVAGQLVDIGKGDQPLSEEVKAKLKGNVALIERGTISFIQKLQFALDNGAVGAVVTNNQPGPIVMGGEKGQFVPIVAISVSQDLGIKIRQEMMLGPVRIEFTSTEFILEKENIDTITDFSSRGPRSEDNLLKPEITAPGKSILSAKMGGGAEGVRLDGTSMSAPHMAGVMALLKQAHPELSVEELKALAMNTSEILMKNNSPYLLTMQGAGRVDTLAAVQSKLLVAPGGVSLGLLQVNQEKVLSKSIQLRNLSQETLQLQVVSQSHPGLEISGPKVITLEAGKTISVNFDFKLSAQELAEGLYELNGFIQFANGNQVAAHVPVLALRSSLSEMKLTASKKSNSDIQLSFTNTGSSTGAALVFNLLGQDKRKEAVAKDQWRSRSCDLESAGYRLVKNAQGKDALQVAFKTYGAQSTWHYCSISVLFDGNGDGIADQELASFAPEPEGAGPARYGAALLDANVARNIRLAYEEKLNKGEEAKLDFTTAFLSPGGILAMDQTSVALMEVELSKLVRTSSGEIAMKLAAQHIDGDTIEADDYLGAELGEWKAISPNEKAQSVYGMQQIYQLPKGVSDSTTILRGNGTAPIVIYYPGNNLEVGQSGSNLESEILP